MALTDTLDQLQAALIAAGVGQNEKSADPWMIYKGVMQDSDLTAAPSKAINDMAICLYETGGRPPLEKWKIDYIGFQVRVRGAADGYTAARQQIQKVYLALHDDVTNLTPDWVYCFATQSGPSGLGIDAKRRPHLVWNFRGMRNRVVA